MKLSDQYLGELRVIAGEYVDAIETFILLHCQFDAAVDCFKEMQRLESSKLNPLNERCDGCINSIEQMLLNTPKLSFMLRHKLNADLRDMRTLNIPAEFKKMTDMMFKSRGLSFAGQCVSDISMHRNNLPKDSVRLAKFKHFKIHEIDFIVTFRNGKDVTWHTLAEGEALSKARKSYKHVTKSLHVDISRSRRSESRHGI